MSVRIGGSRIRDRNSVEGANVAGVRSIVTTLARPPAVSNGGADPVGYRGGVGWTASPGYTGSLTSGTGITFASNQTYTNRDFGARDVGSTGTPLSNVTFRGCRFKASVEKLVGVWGTNITFDYCTFEPGAGTAGSVTYAQGYQYGISADGAYNTFCDKLTITHCEFWGYANAVCVMTSDATNPILIEDCWFHDSRADGGIDHTDGPGQIGGPHAMSFVTINHCTLEDIGNTNGIAFQYGPYADFTITNNLIGGWGYAVAIGAQGPGPIQRITFTGNTFSTRLPSTFGDLYPANFWTGNGNLFRNNRWKVPVGAAYGNLADDGKYWTPSGPSTTDYTG